MSNLEGPQYDRRDVMTDIAAVPMTPVIPTVTTYREDHLDGGGVQIDRVAAMQPVQPMTITPAQGTVITAVPHGAVQTTAYTSRFAPDAIIAAVVGLALLLIGLIAITRGGFDGAMSLPVVKVLGFTHTTTLGLIEIAIGVCLLISGASGSRSGAVFFGAVLGIGGFVGAAQTDSFKRNLALQSGFAWLMVIGAVVVVLSALIMPRYISRRTVVRPM